MTKFPAVLALGAVLCGLVAYSHGHTYKTGECPTVEPMSGFNMQQFLGVWYVIQKTGTASTCVIYNITKGEEPGEYDIEQVSQKAPLSIAPIKHEYSYTGKLTATDKDIPARMTVRFPLSVAGSAKFIVFMTDYSTFAGVFSCQKIPFGHRQSATILSRTRDLDKIYVDKIRNRLSSSSVDPFDLSIIDQTGCPKEGEAGWNIHIDSDTFSAKNIANVFRKAGEKIGDGFEYAVNAGKKLYNQYASSSAEEDISSGNRTERLTMNPNSDAEWLP
ncbi:apolipoprotein D-like [Topomyia yanbarensis]|uniref:apolipoprotein D-like n=1 Tax=Topomyia yanbarensis TaxID=2498891 RepID=UPI00273B5BDC|nr:apolipoprotein D-like [Topomyia yanbarensis]XP_058838706.1 apolipoprotein D-like [Topomyia yanbarensis]XP_058838707.1 apolipoprotein D-like [Topomyia yanbarensis]XP_058838708.1 apolipoprotein D-like [Topomyia yanbarensis]XP_058838709.1 apolipoprotein D-like [Topomyia yanbarensis]XP_058838710.1 apolipoprotein D-like [Topomyia yanbarensis]